MARRVNTKFLTILTVVVVGGVALAMVIPFLLSRRDVGKVLAQADQAMAAKDIERAAQLYGRAAGMASSDPTLKVKLGDALMVFSASKPQAAMAADKAWQEALEIEPGYKPALERLFNSYIEQIDVRPAMRTYDDLRTYARKLSEVDPSNERAKEFVPIATVAAATHGVAVTEQDLRTAVGQLEKMREKRPADPDLLQYLASGYLHQAAERAAGSHPDEARDLRKKAAALVDDATKGEPNDAMVYYRGFLVLTQATQQDQGAEVDKGTLAKLTELINKASSLVKSDSPFYGEIRTQAAMVRAWSDRAAAVKELQDLLKARPFETQAILMLAKLLQVDPAGRAAALELLSRPPVPDPDLRGYRVYKREQLEMHRALDLVNLRLAQYGETTDPKQRESIKAQIEAESTRLSAMVGAEEPEMLKLEGRKLLVLSADPKARILDVITTLERAHDKNQQRRVNDPELTALLATSYLIADQTGPAMTYLQQLAAAQPTSPKWRKMMTQVLLKNAQMDQARGQLDILEKLAPDDPEVAQLRIQTLDAVKDRDQIRKLVDKMPADTAIQRMNKSRVSVSVGDLDAPLKLLVGIKSDDPQYVGAVQMLAQIYALRKEPEQAKAVLADAIKKLPNDSRLKLLAASLDNATPEAIAMLKQEIVAGIADPTWRELQEYGLARQTKDNDKALAHLLAAEKLSPDDPRVVDVLFAWYMEKKDWANSEKYLEKIGKLNIDQADGLVYRVRYDLARGLNDDAMKAATELTRRQPLIGRSWLVLAQVQKATGDNDTAIVNYSKALEKQPDSLDAISGLIECNAAVGRSDLAKQYISRGLQISPSNPYMLEQSRNWDLRFGDPEKVVETMEAAWKRAPDDKPTWMNLGSLYDRAAQVRAMRNPQDPKATEWVQKAVDLFTQASTKWPDEPLFVGRLAEDLVRLGKPDDGLKALNTLAARDAMKDRAEPSLMLAEFYWKFMGKLPEAEKAYLTAVDKAPAAAKNNVRLQLVGFYRQTSKLDQAAALLAQLVKETGDLGIQKQQVDVLIAARKFDDARRVVEEALVKNPNDPQLLTQLAMVHFGAGRLDEALKQLDAALKIDPKFSIAVYYHGLIQLQRGNLVEAIKDLRLAASLNPTNVDFHMSLADALMRHNERNAALSEGEAALSMDTRRKDVRFRLLQYYMGGTPPDWSQFDRVEAEAETITELSRDPVWPQIAARSLMRRGDAAAALKKIQQARALDPNNAELFMDYMDALLATHAFDQVMSETDKLMKDPDAAKQWWVHSLRGAALAGAKREGAMVEFESAISLANTAGDDRAINNVIGRMKEFMGVDAALSWVADHAKTDGRWYVVQALILMEKNDTVAAMQVIDTAMEGFGKLPAAQQDSLLRLAPVVYMANGPAKPAAYEKARLCYVQLLERWDKQANVDPAAKIAVLNNLAFILAENVSPTRPQDAEKYSRTAYDLMQSLGRSDVSVLDTHGWVLVLNGKYQEGMDLLRQASEQSSLVEASYHLGQAYLLKPPVDAGRAVTFLEHAKAMMDDQIRAKQPVDPALKLKVEAALARARQLSGTKSPASHP